MTIVLISNDRQTDRQTETKTDKGIFRQTDIKPGRQTDWPTDTVQGTKSHFSLQVVTKYCWGKMKQDAVHRHPIPNTQTKTVENKDPDLERILIWSNSQGQENNRVFVQRLFFSLPFLLSCTRIPSIHGLWLVWVFIRRLYITYIWKSLYASSSTTELLLYS